MPRWCKQSRKDRRAALSMLVVLLAIVGLAACGHQPRAMVVPAGVAVAQSQQPRDLAPAVDPDTQARLSDDTTAFALRLYAELRNSQDNLIVSPYSIASALAQVYAGARGETAHEMARALNFSLPHDALHPAFNVLDLQLTSPKASEGLTLTMANGLWIQTEHELRPEYLDLLAEHYSTGLYKMNVSSEEGREQTRQAINTWTREATRNRIQELIGDYHLTALSRFVLATATTFEARWRDPFDATEDGAFQLLDGSTITVPRMSRDLHTTYAQGDNYEVVTLPYHGECARMIVLLPASGQFDAVEQALNRDFLRTALQGLKPANILVKLPKFSFENSLELNKALDRMGMQVAFRPGAADFSGIDGTHELFIEQLVHKTYIQVDEQKTEAGSAFAVIQHGLLGPEPPPALTIDRPFLFLIEDTATGTILFVGRVLNPLAT